jgi:hypothetical protein
MVNQPASRADTVVKDGHPFFDIVQDAYRVFAFPKPPHLDVCDCCMPSQVENELLATPIRALPYRYIRDWYLAECQQHQVNRATWGYLLPRILEILVSGHPVSEISLEISLRRFETGNPDNWNVAQWDVLDRFQRLFLQQMIEGNMKNSYYLKNYCLDDVLCMFRLGGWSLESLLKQVIDTPDELLAKRFWSDWCEGYPAQSTMVGVTKFWDDHDKSELRS